MKTLCSIVLILAGISSAQTVSPLISEYGKRARGSFTVRNSGVTPLTVTLTPEGISLTPDGETKFVPILTTTHLTLRETSARLGPLAQHDFDYEMRCDVLPCVLSVFATFYPPKKDGAMQVALAIPSTIYICAREKDCRTKARAELFNIPAGK